MLPRCIAHRGSSLPECVRLLGLDWFTLQRTRTPVLFVYEAVQAGMIFINNKEAHVSQYLERQPPCLYACPCRQLSIHLALQSLHLRLLQQLGE